MKRLAPIPIAVLGLILLQLSTALGGSKGELLAYVGFFILGGVIAWYGESAARWWRRRWADTPREGNDPPEG